MMTTAAKSAPNKHRRSSGNTWISYLLLSLLGFIMIYPLLWMVGASFKPNGEIFADMSLIPKGEWVFSSYKTGWNSIGQYTFGHFFINTFKIVIPTVLFTLVSSTLVAYGFARFRFPLKKLLFTLMISTLMLPNAVVMIPKYIMFRNFGWLDSYKPFIVPSMFASSAFIVFMLIQFLRGLPRELDESALLDGCGSFRTLVNILLPLCKPALFSAGLFQFIWQWNDFFNSLIYINSVSKYTLALGLRMSLDVQSGAQWNQIMAMSVLSILPCVILFFAAQKYFVEGIATTGLKG
jgi:oligogalacturonide transport system permease protein